MKSRVVLWITLVFSVPAFAQNYLFDRVYLQAQTSPHPVATADLNNDGAADLITANTTSNMVSVFKNLKNGKYSTSPTLKTGVAPAALAVADFNGDGKLDLAVANSSDNTVSVFLGKGDTTFTLASTPAVGTTPNSIVSADFNGDHKMDLAVENQGSNTVSVLLGNGDGTFQSIADVSTNPGPLMVLTGDLNKDGKADLAILDPNQVTPFLGNGDGTFSAQAGITASPGPVAMVLGDFNGDAKLDLALANFDGKNLPKLLVFSGQGDGSFVLTSTILDTGLAPLALAAGDVNGDGKLDLVSSHIIPPKSNNQGNVSVFLGAGNGSFTLTQTLITEATGGLAVADVNRDGAGDVIESYPFSGKLTVFIGQGNGLLLSTGKYNVGGHSAEDIAAADFNEDGFDDLAVVLGGSTSLAVLLNNGDGTFGPVNNLPIGGFGGSEVIADFNKDGHADIAAANGIGGVSVLLGKGNGQFLPPVAYSTGTAIKVVTADLNQDGISDLLVDYFNGTALVALLGKGDGTFGPPISSPTSPGQPLGPGIGDLDNDGIPDAVVGYNFSDQIDVFHGNGDGTFTLLATYHAGQSNISIQIADLNNDGKADVVIGNNGIPSNVLIFFGNGDGTLSAPQAITVNNSVTQVSLLDWNRDGKLDVGTVGGTTFAILPGNGDGTFSPEFDLLTGASFIGVAAGNFSGAGGFDAALLDLSNDTVTIVLNQPIIALAGRRLTFPGQKVGTMSVPLPVKITNPGTVPLSIKSITTTGDFTQTNNCGSSVAVGASCTINVVFAPTQVGTRSGTLTIDDNAPSGRHVVTLLGTGT
jgi:hypothetical protein